MKNIEIKSFVIGFLLAVVLVMASGNGASNSGDGTATYCGGAGNSYAVPVPQGGYLLVKDYKGEALIINEKGDMTGFGLSPLTYLKLAE